MFPTNEFRLGYHVIPSMKLLHLHIISQDFDSPYLRSKKHWHSFTSNWLQSPEWLEQMIENQGNYQV
jgi:aprataxin